MNRLNLESQLLQRWEYIKQKYTVHTASATYTEIYAFSPDHAKKIVWKMTMGRERPENMTAVRS